jgi:hypothetical protein
MSAIPKAKPAPPEPAPTPPSPLQQMEELASAGDFASLVEYFLAAPAHYEHFARLPGLLRDAVVRASRKSPRRFTGEAYRQMVTFLTYVGLRLQICVERRLQVADGERQPLRDELPEDLVERLMAPLERIARLNQEACQAWASADRRWALARQRRRKAPRNRLNPNLFDGSAN